jgi:hypothetical protein
VGVISLSKDSEATNLNKENGIKLNLVTERKTKVILGSKFQPAESEKQRKERRRLI